MIRVSSKGVSSLLLVFLTVTLGCAAGKSLVTYTGKKGVTVAKARKGKATILFMRPSSLGATTTATVYERLSNGNLKFIGCSVHGSVIVHKATPGRHIYAVVSEAADFIEVRVKSGLIYPVVVAPRVGAWAARFSLKSACRNTEYWSEVRGWLDNSSEVRTNEKARQWFVEHKRTLLKKTNRYWEKWKAKPEKPLIRPADGSRRI